jgi:ferrous iron transport protein B
MLTKAQPLQSSITPQARRVVALVGNPNCGKSTLFNALTGYRQNVANYPGVTIDSQVGQLRHASNELIDIVDLPGSYSLSPQSADEMVVNDVLFGRRPHVPPVDLVVAVLDASNLERHLFLASQILEMGKPVVVVLTMVDLAERAGLAMDLKGLARQLGVPVMSTVATRGTGVAELRDCILAKLDEPAPRPPSILPESVRREVSGMADSLAQGSDPVVHRQSSLELAQFFLDPGGYAETRLLAHVNGTFTDELAARRRRLTEAGVALSSIEGRSRYEWARRIIDATVTRDGKPRRSKSDAVDRVLTHRVLGTAIFVIAVGIVFQAIYNWSVPMMDAIESLFGGLGRGVAAIVPAGALQSLLVDGVIAGVGAILVFLPQIVILFLLIGLLEDCGYMARGALLMDRLLRFFGLGGKSFIPLLSSFACAVPGIMAARTIENRADRFVTILLAPLMSCSARLPVYVLLISVFVPATTIAGGLVGLQGLVLLAMSVLGVIVAIPVGLLAKRFFFRGQSQPFFIELPAYRWPSLRNVLFRAYIGGRGFMVNAGTLIFAVTIVIWAMGYFPRSGEVAAEHEALRGEAVQSLSGAELEGALQGINRAEAGENLRNSLLGRIGRFVEPAVAPLGWDWKIGTAVIASFPAREVVIATMGTLYNLGGDQEGDSRDLRSAIQSATHPDGSKVFSLPVALSIMVFFALCCQCAATLAIIKKETASWRWPALTFVYMTTLAYLAAFGTYRASLWFS